MHNLYPTNEHCFTALWDAKPHTRARAPSHTHTHTHTQRMFRSKNAYVVDREKESFLLLFGVTIMIIHSFCFRYKVLCAYSGAADKLMKNGAWSGRLLRCLPSAVSEPPLQRPYLHRLHSGPQPQNQAAQHWVPCWGSMADQRQRAMVMLLCTVQLVDYALLQKLKLPMMQCGNGWG